MLGSNHHNKVNYPKLKDTCSLEDKLPSILKVQVWKKGYDEPRQHIKKQSLYFASKGPFSQTYGFSSICVWM